MTLFVAILAVTPAFAACLDDLPFSRPDPDEAPMGSLYSVARDDAKAWSSRAILTSASTFEGRSDAFKKANFTLPQDPALGNGRSVFWAYEFADPETGDEHTVIVAAHNRSILVRESDEDGDGKVSVDGVSWGVESDTAAARAHGDARFADALKNVSDPGFMILLSSEEDENASEEDARIPVWTIVGMNSKENKGAYALVNGFTGDVIIAGPWKGWDMGDWGNFFPEKKVIYEDRGGGDLTVTAPSAKADFPIDASKATARLTVCHGQSKPAGDVRFAVYDSSGKEVGKGGGQRANSGPQMGVRSWSAHDLPVGTYEARFTLATGVAVDYRYHIEVFTGTDWSFNIPGYTGPYMANC